MCQKSHRSSEFLGDKSEWWVIVDETQTWSWAQVVNALECKAKGLIRGWKMLCNLQAPIYVRHIFWSHHVFMSLLATFFPTLPAMILYTQITLVIRNRKKNKNVDPGTHFPAAVMSTTLFLMTIIFNHFFLLDCVKNFSAETHREKRDK